MMDPFHIYLVLWLAYETIMAIPLPIAFTSILPLMGEPHWRTSYRHFSLLTPFVPNVSPLETLPSPERHKALQVYVQANKSRYEEDWNWMRENETKKTPRKPKKREFGRWEIDEIHFLAEGTTLAVRHVCKWTHPTEGLRVNLLFIQLLKKETRVSFSHDLEVLSAQRSDQLSHLYWHYFKWTAPVLCQFRLAMPARLLCTASSSNETSVTAL